MRELSAGETSRAWLLKTLHIETHRSGSPMSVSKGIGLLAIALSGCLAPFDLDDARAADRPGCGALPTMQQTVKCLNERRIAEARREAPETVPMWLECAEGMEMFARDLDEGSCR